MEDHFLFHENPEFLTAVRERISQLADGPAVTAQLFSVDKWRRPPKHHRDVLFVMGGFQETVETFNARSGEWVSHKIRNAPSRPTWTATVDHLVLVLEEESQRFQSFNVVTRQWTELKPLPIYRALMCLTQEGSHVYALGGLNHGQKCHSYSIERNEWREVASLENGRWGAGAASLAGLVYCAGGYRESSYSFLGWIFNIPFIRYLSSVEMFDPKENRWSFAPPMNGAGLFFCLASCGRFLWAVGGWNRQSLAGLEKYDPERRCWAILRPMSGVRCNLSASFYGGLLYVTGGRDDSTTLSTVETYNPSTNSWTTCQSLSQRRHAHGSCVVKALAVADKYDEPTD